MKLIIGKSNMRGVIIAETENDKDTLKTLYHSHIIFGFYAYWEDTPEKKGRDDARVKKFLDSYPDAKAIGFINCPDGFNKESNFMPKIERKELSKTKELKQTLFDGLED